jgi:phenylpropionate dioxygenase-like ring-hydroxylating dioxygenase large terminal subunit
MRVVKRVRYEVGCNWKLLVENAMEEYHTGTVHRGSLGQQHSLPEETRGAWDALFIPQATSIAVLPGEAAPFPHIATLAGRPASGSYFTMVYPNTQFACTQDCMWWLTFRPLGPERTGLTVGFCFPETTVARPDFEREVAPYLRRWAVSIGEDNAIGEVQQAGLRSTLRPPGPMAAREFAVHRVYQWILDRVLDGAGSP